MISSARNLGAETTLSADVVVVGAGPGGIAAALELTDAGVDVILVESGGEGHEPQAQELSAAAWMDPSRHSPMSLTNRRQFGGASTIWGGRCVPYDPVDFDHRPLVGDARWPITYDDVAPYFGRACELSVCGRPCFDATEDPMLARSELVPGLPPGDVRSTSLERWSLPTNFGREYRDRIGRSTRLQLFTHLTCTRIRPDSTGTRVEEIEARTAQGARVALKARRYVLACGGLETTRLLLASPGPQGAAIGNHSGHLGRWYMAHLEGSIAQVQFRTPAELTTYDYERDRDGVYVRRRITFSREALNNAELPNIAFWLGNHQLNDPTHGSGLLSAVYLALASPLGPRLAPDALRLSLIGEVVPGAPYGGGIRGPAHAHWANIARQLSPTTRFVADFARRRLTGRRRAPGFFVWRPDNRYVLQYHAEHLPRYDSRVWLSDEHDALGVPRLNIDLRFGEEDVDGVVRSHRELDGYLRRGGHGELVYSTDDAAARVWDQAGGGFHQIGTTRMSARPSDGVVDEQLAVHGYPNLHVLSSSVFVTSGQANSTFMIVAFAVRLAARIRADLSAWRHIPDVPRQRSEDASSRLPK
jgi:choline dehydrogenase-like flavoprotein